MVFGLIGLGLNGWTTWLGELDAFVAEELKGFYKDGSTPSILGSRSMPLGEDFFRWMDQARSPPPTQVVTRESV